MLNKSSKFWTSETLEKLEDIEILRFIEKGIKVKVVLLSNKSKSVDTLDDVKIVKKYI